MIRAAIDGPLWTITLARADRRNALTPEVSDALLAAVIGNCKAETLLTIACDLTAATQEIITRTIGQWRRMTPPLLHKRPTVFLLLAGSAKSANRRARPAHVK